MNIGTRRGVELSFQDYILDIINYRIKGYTEVNPKALSPIIERLEQERKQVMKMSERSLAKRYPKEYSDYTTD